MGKHYALSDLHGCYDYLSAIKNYINEDDCVFFLGDAADRGDAGWDCIKSIRYNPCFYYICGNHEDMLRKATIEYYDDDISMISALDLYFQNGGARTYNEWIEEGAKHEWISYLESLPLTHVYTNLQGQKIILSHAGFTPITKLNLFPRRKEILWGREHFKDEWVGDKNIYIVHGHTPTPKLNAPDRDYSNDWGAISYCGGRKFCIDNGTVWTGVCTLFDLDTFNSIIFKRNRYGNIVYEVKESML